MNTKIKRILTRTLLVVFAACMFFGVYFATVTPKKQTIADSDVDVTDKVVMTYAGEGNGVVEIDLTFDGITNVLPTGLGATWANDNPTKFDIDPMTYIKIGANTARAIVAGNASANVYNGQGGAPMSWGGQYAPIGVLVDTSGIIRIKTYTSYCAYSNLSITILNGFRLTNADGNTLVCNADVTYSYDSGYFVNAATTKVDAVTAANMFYHSESNGILEIDLKFDGVTNVYPEGVTQGTWVNDHASMGTMDLMSKIKIGANTARAIVAGNASANVYSGVGGAPMSWGGKWAPIGVVVDGNGIIRIKIYTSYCTFNNLSITIVGGLVWFTSDGVMIKCTADTTFGYDSGIFVKTTAEKINVDGIANFALISTNNNTPASDGTYSKITLTFDGVTRVMSKGAVGTGGSGGFWVNDNAVNYTYGVDLMNYLYINGVSARSVVGTSGTGLVTAVATFGPVAVCVWPTSIEIRVRNSYINYEDLYITLKSGWGLLTDDGKMLKTTQDCTYRHYVDGVGNHSYEYATDFIDLSETTVHFENLVKADKTYNGASATRFQFWFDGVNEITHKKSNGTFCVNDHATDKTDGVDLMQYIYVNGVSARSIVNDNIAGNLDKTYVGLADGSSTTTFGPICVYMFSGKHFQIRIDDSYLDYDDIFLTIKAGLVWWTGDNKVLTVSSDMTFCFKKSASWTEENHLCDTYKVEDLIAADTFDMQKGAGVRTAVAAGIRFTAQYAEDEFDYWTNHAGCTVEVGMLLTKESIIGGDALTIASVSANKAVKLVCSNNSDTAKDGYYLFHGGISPMSSTASYSVNYVGRAYMKITVNGNEYYKYATVNDNVRSIVTVATLAIESGTLSPAEETFLQGIIDAAA